MSRRRNGEKDGKGRAKRRRNGAGTVIFNKHTKKWEARYYLTRDGITTRRSKTLDASTVEEARTALEALLEGQKTFIQEDQYRKAVAKLEGVQKEIAEAKRKEDAARAKAEADERDRKAVKIADAWPLYVASKKRPDSGQRTLDGYRSQYEAFADWCAKNMPDTPKMRDFTPAMAESFIDHIEKTRSRNTRNKYLILLRTVWRVMRWNADAQLSIDPWDGIRTLTTTPDKVTRRDLTVEELGRIAAYLRTDEAKAAIGYTYRPTDTRKSAETWDLRHEMLSLVALGVYLGARLGDCVNLQWSAVDLALGTITFMPRKTARKYKREVTAPIHPALARLLASVPSENRRGYLLPMLAEIYKREPSMLTNRFQSVLRAVGIETTTDAPDGEGGGTRARVAVGFHSLRHFFAAWLDNHGVNHALTNYLTCHEQGKVEAGYYHGNREALAAAVATLPTIPMLTGDAEAVEIAPADAPRITDGQSAAPTADASQGRFEAFCAIAKDLTADELQRAIGYLTDLKSRSENATLSTNA